MEVQLGVAVFLAFTFFPSACSVEKHTNVRIVPAAKLVQIRDVTVYESTVKLIFMVDIGNIGRSFSGKGNVTNPILSRLSDLSSIVHDDILEEVSGFRDHGQPKKREKRQIGMGIAFVSGLAIHSMWGKISKVLFGNDDDVRNYVTELRSHVVDFQNELVVLETNLKDYGEEISKVLRETMEIQDQEMRAVINSLTLLLQRSWILESKYACLSKTIPNHFVSHQILHDKLYKLNERLHLVNMTLAIPLDRFSEMYKLPLADCTFTPSKIVISINVPIKRLSEQWILYEMIHNKFAYEGKTCSLYPHETNYLARSQDRAILITSHLLQQCPVHEHSICHIPWFSRDSSGSVGCALALLDGKEVGELANTCSFSCFPSTELQIQQLDDFTVILTNVKTLVTICPSGTETREFELIGAVQVRTRCNCTMIVNDFYNISPPLFCPNEKIRGEHVVQISPNLWSRLDNAIGKNTQTFKSHSNQTFNRDWINQVPTLLIKKFEPEYIPDPPVMWDYSSRDVIMAAVVCQIFLLWVCVFGMCCIYCRA